LPTSTSLYDLLMCQPNARHGTLQGERLKALTLNSSAAQEVLQRKLKSAETVLQLSELCRKFETEQEKVLPFMVSPQVRQARASYTPVESMVWTSCTSCQGCEVAKQQCGAQATIITVMCG
jgi:hypothetical protein